MSSSTARPALQTRPMAKGVALLLVIASMLFFTITATGPAQAAPADPLRVPVTGTSATGPVSGTVDITRVVRRGGETLAVGTFTGTVGTTSGSQDIALPVNLDATSATCDILHLVLGPLDLDLLGLVVHLDQVVLDITAEQGPGNLLGNLLCAVAGLLDGSGGLSGLTGLLNRILGILS